MYRCPLHCGGSTVDECEKVWSQGLRTRRKEVEERFYSKFFLFFFFSFKGDHFEPRFGDENNFFFSWCCRSCRCCWRCCCCCCCWCCCCCCCYCCQLSLFHPLRTFFVHRRWVLIVFTQSLFQLPQSLTRTLSHALTLISHTHSRLQNTNTLSPF